MAFDNNKLTLDAVRLFKSSILVSDSFMDGDQNLDSYSFSFDLKTGTILEEDTVLLRLNIKIDGKYEEQAVDVKGEFGIEFRFLYENLVEFVFLNGDERIIDLNFGGILTGIAFSTARGMVLQQTQETYIGGVILPIINPTELLQESLGSEG
jgi:hypothetical protein